MVRIKALLTKQISFPINGYLAKILNSWLFPNLGVMSIFYFLMVFAISFALWMPVGAVTVMILVSLLHLLESGGVNIQKLAQSNWIIEKFYAALLVSILILIVSFVCLYMIRKLDILRKEQLPPFLLKSVTVAATIASYILFIYMIRGWWFLN